MLLQVVKMSDEVTVSSLPHPISMFFLGIFAISIIFMWIEVNRSTKRKDKLLADMECLKKEFSEYRTEMSQKFSELSKKIDSRVDKAVVSLKKQGKVINE
jgi:uncharacterized membrane-anchored protein YhcB (DUF1043 family)